MFLSAAVAFAAGFKLFTATTDVFAGAFCIGQRRRLLHRSRLDSSRPGITLKIGGSHLKPPWFSCCFGGKESRNLCVLSTVACIGNYIGTNNYGEAGQGSLGKSGSVCVEL